MPRLAMVLSTHHNHHHPAPTLTITTTHHHQAILAPLAINITGHSMHSTPRHAYSVQRFEVLTRKVLPATTLVRCEAVAATLWASATSNSMVTSTDPAVACSLRLPDDAVDATFVMMMSAVLFTYGGMYNQRAWSTLACTACLLLGNCQC